LIETTPGAIGRVTCPKVESLRAVDAGREASLNLDLSPELDNLSRRHAKKAAERSALRRRKANSVSRQTHIPGTSALGMMVSRPM
jgi:hypothetical protein